MKGQLALAATIICSAAFACKKEAVTAGVASVAPIRILIVGEGFSSEKEFAPFAMRMKTAIEATPGAAAAGQGFDIQWKLASAPTGVTHSGDCYFDADGAAQQNVRKETLQNFDTQRYLVIENVTGAREGCSYGNITIVANDTTPSVVAHEMGHNLAGLFDEYGSKPNAPPDRNFRNCSNAPVYWGTPPGGKPNCDHYSGLMHLTNGCIMYSPNASDFCDICKKHLKCALADGVLGGCPDGPPPAPLPPAIANGHLEGLDVVAVIDRVGGVTAISASDVRLSSLRPQVINGDLFAVVRDGETIAGVAPLSVEKADVPDDGRFPLTARAYRQGYERVVPVDALLVRFTVAGVTKATLRQHDLTLDLRRVNDARKRFFLDDATVGKLAGAPSSPPYPLQSALEMLPP